VLREHLVLVCPACQASDADWAGALDRCARCAGAHLIRRLDQIECLDCGFVRDSAPSASSALPASSAALAEEVSRALERVLGRR
jgi:hypothetical protein